MRAILANGPDSWVWWDWVGRHGDEIVTRAREHVVLTLVSVLAGALVAFPLAIAATRVRRLAAPSLWVAGVIYTIPSLALFALLVPWTGLSRTTALIGLTSYTLLILLRNALIGLQSVPDDVKEAASGMGYSDWRRLVSVELPLAVPALIAGLRIATVTTVGLVAVTALIGQGGFGQFILDGYERAFRTPLVLGSVLSIALAVAADLAFLALQRLVTPWDRARA